MHSSRMSHHPRTMHLASPRSPLISPCTTCAGADQESLRLTAGLNMFSTTPAQDAHQEVDHDAPSVG